MVLNVLDEFFEKFNYWMTTSSYKKILKEEIALEEKLNIFLSKFTIDYIKTMPIDDYVTGKKNKMAFCSYVEVTLRNYGSISGRTTAYQKYVIYWDKRNKKYSFGSAKIKKRAFFGDDQTDIYNNVIKELINVINATKNGDLKSIEINHLNDQFKNKVSFLYDHKNQLPIYSNDDLDKILTLFNVPFDSKLNRVYKRKILYDFYVSTGIKKLMSPFIFMFFIYSDYGYRFYLRDRSSLNVDLHTITLNNVKIKNTIPMNNSKVKREGLYDSSSEIKKRMTGKKAEELVIDFLNSNKSELDVNHLIAWCNIDDSKGYDISYKKSDGTEIFVEVKSTKMNLGDKISFDMSLHEHEVMKENINNYFIFFVNDTYNARDIKRISALDLFGEEPIKFRYQFEAEKIKD